MKKINKPNLRFKEFKNEWKCKKIKDVGEVKTFKRIFKNETKEKGEIPFYKIGTFGKKANSFISNDIYQEYKNKYPYPKYNDILISASGTLGRTVIYKGEKAYFQDSNIIWIDTKNTLDKGFLYQLYKNISWGISEGSTIKRLYNKNVLSTEINIPSKDEQGKIGLFLNKIDNLIELKNNKIKSLERLKHGYLQKLFNNPYENKPKLRFKKFKDNWRQNKLNEITDVKDGTHESPKYVKHGYPLVTSKNLLDNGLDMNDVSYISLKDFENINKRSKVDKGDIIFGMIGTIGKPNIIYNNDFAIKNIALIKNNSNISNYFILNLLKSNVFDKYIYSHNAGGTQKFISLNLIREFTFNAPSIEEQSKIGAIMNLIDKQINLQKNELKRLKRLKKGYLQNMFV